MIQTPSRMHSESPKLPQNESKRATRSNLQSRSLHLFCDLLAKELNMAGLDMKTVLKPDVEIPWSKTTVKEYIWRPIQKALTTKISTTEIDTVEPSEIWEVINRHLGQKFGIEVPLWPSQENRPEHNKWDCEECQDNMRE